MKIITYNVNGIRAVIKKGFLDWLKATQADILCLQELKASADQLPKALFEELGYQIFIHSAQKKGYSGVAILVKKEWAIRNVQIGCGIEKYDAEGRVIRVDLADFSVMSVYMPSGSSGEERQAFKFGWLDDFATYIEELRKTCPKLIVAGDYNICHKAIDIHNPVGLKNASGFLPPERAWIDQFIESGFVDTFRYFCQEPHHYTWWSMRGQARAKNLGWRIDYVMCSDNLKDNLENCHILKQTPFADHCPVLLELKASNEVF